MSDVFVCYAREDQAFVRSLHAALDRRGREAWVDWQGIPLAEEWLAEIHRAIDSADSFLFVISPDSAASEICREELDYAIAHGKRLVPIVRRDAVTAEVHPALRQLNWLFFREADGFEGALEALLRTVDADLPWVRAHTRLLTRAVEWDGLGRDRSYLLRGTDLEEAGSWWRNAAGRDPAPTSLHTAYLMASQEAVREEQARWKRLYDEALARHLAAQSELTRTEHPALLERAVLLAAEALRRAPFSACDRALRAALAVLPRYAGELAAPTTVNAMALSPDGVTLAVSGPTEVMLHDLSTGRCTARFETGTAGTPGRLLFSRDGKRLAVIAGVHHDLRRTVMFAMAYGGAEPGPGQGPVGDVTSTVIAWDLSDNNRELARMRHEQYELKSAAFPQDGRTLATAGMDGTVRLWALPGGTEVARLVHESHVNQVVFAEDGGTLATASADRSARVWDASGREVARVIHDAEVTAVSLCEDRGASACSRTVHVWTASKGQRWVTFEAATPVERVILHGSHVIAICQDYSVQAWSIFHREEAARRKHPGPVHDVVFPSDRLRTSCIAHEVAHVYDTALTPTENEGEVMRVAHDARGGVKHVALSSNGGRVVTGGDSVCRAWEPSDACLALELKHRFITKGMTFGRRGRLLAVADDGGSVVLWSLPDAACVLRAKHEKVPRMLFGADDRMFVTASDDGRILVHDLDAQTMRELAIPRRVGGRVAVAMRSDGARLVAANSPGFGLTRMCLWDPRDGREVSTHRREGDGFEALAFTPDGSRIVGGGRSLRFWDAETGRELLEIPTGTTDSASGCRALAFDPNGRFFVSSEGRHDGFSHLEAVAVVRDADDGRELTRLADGKRLSPVKFAPTGDALAAADGQQIRVWASDLRELAPLIHDQFVPSFNWSSDGKYLASASPDGVRVWRLADAREVARVQPRRPAREVALNPAGTLLTVASHSVFVHLWWWQQEDMLRIARKHTTRTLTREEWVRFVGEEPYPGENPSA